jgi:carbon-monoxide dehydrogenase medium subunit
VKPAPFAYVRPRTLDAAIAALKDDPGARPIAGGQSLIPWLAMRRLRPSALVDITAVPELDRLDLEAGELVIGATVRQRRLERDERVRAASPLLHTALRAVGYPQSRARGTVGGSLAHLDPRAELPVVALALDASLGIAGPSGSRTSTFEAFARGPYRPDLREGELLIAIRLPLAQSDARWAFHEIARRPNDLADAIAAGIVDGPSVRIAIGALDGPPVRLSALERAVAAGEVRADGTRRSAKEALAAIPFGPDPMSGPPEHRRALAATCLSRMLDALLAPIGSSSSGRP